MPLDRNPYPALAKFVAGATGGAEAERALAAFQIGDTHTREQYTWKLFRWEGDRNADHRAKDARLPQPMPERRTTTQALDFRFAQWHRVLADAQAPFRPANLGRREKRKIAAKVSGEEIVVLDSLRRLPVFRVRLLDVALPSRSPAP